MFSPGDRFLKGESQCTEKKKASGVHPESRPTRSPDSSGQTSETVPAFPVQSAVAAVSCSFRSHVQFLQFLHFMLSMHSARFRQKKTGRCIRFETHALNVNLVKAKLLFGVGCCKSDVVGATISSQLICGMLGDWFVVLVGGWR